MLLYLSSRRWEWFLGRAEWTHRRPQFASEESLEASDDVSFAQSLFGAAFHVGPGLGVVAESDEHHAVEGSVGLSVTTAVQPVPIGSPR